MIRRAQAEALLKLAEALEECERNGVELFLHPDGDAFSANGHCEDLSSFDGLSVRYAVAKLYPKSEEAE